MKQFGPNYIKTRPVWTGFKIAAWHKLLTHNKTRLQTAYKTGNNKYYCFIMNKLIDRWIDRQIALIFCERKTKTSQYEFK